MRFNDLIEAIEVFLEGHALTEEVRQLALLLLDLAKATERSLRRNAELTRATEESLRWLEAEAITRHDLESVVAGLRRLETLPPRAAVSVEEV